MRRLASEADGFSAPLASLSAANNVSISSRFSRPDSNSGSSSIDSLAQCHHILNTLFFITETSQNYNIHSVGCNSHIMIAKSSIGVQGKNWKIIFKSEVNEMRKRYQIVLGMPAGGIFVHINGFNFRFGCFFGFDGPDASKNRKRH